MKGGITVLLVAGALIAMAVVVRVWLAATGSYGDAGLPVMLRIGSAAALVVGLLLAGLAVAWPVRRVAGPRKPQNRSNS